MSTLRTAIHAKSFPKPTGAGIVNLKMKDGGPVPATSLRGMYNSAVDTVSRLRTSDAEKRANRSMAAPVATPAPAPVAVAAPVQDIPAPMGSQSVLARREAAAGLRNGGPVGGKGQGDKVPAMLEPEEFVVSNDMMDDNPSLRGALHSMRAESLAKKGMTPAEADAKAVHFEGKQGEAYERAAVRQGGEGNGGPDGYGQDVQVRGNPEMDEQPRRAGGAAGLGSLRGNQTAGLRIHALDGIDVSERPWNGSTDSRAFAAQPGPGNPNIGPEGSAEAKAWRKPTTMPVDTGVAPAATKAQALRGSVNKFLGAGESAGDVAGAFKNVTKPIVGAGAKALQFAGKVAAPLTAGAAAYQGLNTDTETYAKRFGLENTEPGMARDLGVRALGVASDIGNDMTFGLAKKYLYRDGENGDPLLRAPQTPTAAAPPKAVEPLPVIANPPENAPAPNNVNVTRQPNGNLSFSGTNIKGEPTYAGDGASSLRTGGAGITSMPAAAFMGSSPAADANAAALRMEAAKRGDWDAVNSSLAAQGQGPVRGTQTSGGGGGGNSPRDMIMNQLRGAGKLSVTGMKIANDVMTGDNQLRGNQMQYDSSMYGHNVQNTNNVRTNDTNMLRNDREGRQWLAEHGEKVSNSAFERQQKGNEAFEKSLASLYPGEDGKGDQKQITAHRQMATNYVNDLVQTLKDSGDTKSADALAQAGPGALHTNHHAEISMAMRTRAALEKANGWMPTTGGYKDSTHPKAWKPIGYEKRGVGGDHVLFPNGHISVNDLRGTPFYNQTGGTTDFDQIITDAQAAQAKRKGAK